MRRCFALTLAAALLMALLCACGASDSRTPAVPPGPVGESASIPPEPTPSQEPFVPPSEKPTKKVPTKPGKVDLAAFAQTVQENHEFPMLEKADPSDELGAVMLDNYYPGLTGMDLAQMEVYLAVISFRGGELALVQAKNAGDAAAVKAIFQARIDAKTAVGRGNYPEEIELWQHNSAVASNGSYVMLVNHEDSAAIVSEFNALFS